MSSRSHIRGGISMVLSAAIHLGFVAALLVIPHQTVEEYDTVDLTVAQRVQKPEPEPEPKPEPEPEPEDIKTAPPVKKVSTPIEEVKPPPPPPEAPPPEEAPEAPPVFDLGDNSFATNDGQGGNWQLNRSEGNTKFAGVAKKPQPSARNSRPSSPETGGQGGKGDRSDYRPVPLKDLSKRPMPQNGAVPTPTYPLEARRADIEGPVVMQVFLDKQGHVRQMRIIKSPSEVLSEAAKRTMSGVRWTPALDRVGKPVDTIFVYTFRFVLDG